ncbi:exocyst complex component Sec3-domain-containing protein [Phlyctochytrium arcticum]|nr:exocyst complex component Sec3-domain-containing protein [Phlyctochytrium arcticum]
MSQVEDTLRRNLSNSLFVGFDDTSSATSPAAKDKSASDAFEKYNERLLLNVKVTEEGKGGKKKVRIVCLTVKKNLKIRLHKVKQIKGGGFSIGKTWSLDDIKSVESAEDTVVVVNLGKSYRWALDDTRKKAEFLFTLTKLCKKYLKKLPKFINVDEENLKAQMHLNASHLSTAEKEFTATFAAMSSRSRGVAIEEDDDSEFGEELERTAVQPDAPDVNLNEVLADFQWHAAGDATALEARLVSELQALEAANVHAIISSEEQAQKVVAQLDTAIGQLDQIHEWIARYTNLLDSMGQDVHQIEIRHKGMQIASHNQQLLLAEVEGILSTLRVPAYIIEILRTEPLNEAEGIAQCEDATRKLGEVTKTKFNDAEMANLQAVKEQLALLNGYGNQFALRLHDYLVGYFQTQAEAYLQDKSRSSKRGSLRLHGHDSIEENLFRFRKLLKWLKDVDTRKHHNLQMAYAQEMGRVYTKDIHEFIELFRAHHMQRKGEAETLDYMFSTPSVSVSSAATQALKSAIKGSQNNLHFANSASFVSNDRPERGDRDSKEHRSSIVGGVAALTRPKFESLKAMRGGGGSGALGLGGGGGITSSGGGSSSGSGPRSGKRDSVTYPPDSLREDDGSDEVASMKSARSGNRKGDVGKGSMMSLDLGQDEKMAPDEALGHTLSLLFPMIVREQNFITDLFSLHKSHQSALSPSSAISSPIQPDESASLPSPVTDKALNPPETPSVIITATSPYDVDLLEEPTDHWQDALRYPREPIKDLKLSKRIEELVKGIFDDVREEIILVLEAGLKTDQTYAVGMLVRVQHLGDDYKDTCHTYVILLLEDIGKRITAVFDKFLEDQVRGIDEVKVTFKKRSGILSFIRVFPHFVDRMERCLNGSSGAASTMVHAAYAKVVRAMLETLDAMAQQVASDPKAQADDKEHLNIHILHVENMHHFYSEIRARKVPHLDVYVKQAKAAYDVHLDAYCKVVIRKPLGKLFDFFEGIETLLKTNTPEEVNYHLQYNKAALKEVVKKHPGKEVKKGLETLYKRVEKHYTDEEGLLQVVWRGIQEECAKRIRRYEELIGICYPEVPSKLEFSMEELLGYFSELARAH